MKTFKGTVFYASNKAKNNRYIKEGSKVTIDNFYHAITLGEKAIQIDFDSSGQNYIHLITT